MSELRVIKTEMELEVLRYVALVSSAAHMHVMRNLKPGMREYQAESMFKHYSYNHGGLFTFLLSYLFTFLRAELFSSLMAHICQDINRAS